jgi:transcriptional regulator with XRE-family HTH domain
VTPDEIVRLLASKGLTQANIARRIGISRASVNDIISGKSKGATGRFAFAAAIGEDPDRLWPREPKPPKPPEAA